MVIKKIENIKFKIDFGKLIIKCNIKGCKNLDIKKLGNHTVNHKSMPDLTEEEIRKEVIELHQVIYEKFNYDMKYIRPPKGEFSERTLKITNTLGYKTVMWSFAYEDWNEDKQPEEERSLQKIVNNIHNGEIMLLHGNSKTNTNILDKMIKEVKNMGYEFKSLDEFE